MQRQLRLYNDTLRQQGIRLSAGIGIHAGEVIAGYLGTHERMEYTVIGHNVNVVLDWKAKPEPLPTLLFSDEVARRIGHTLPVRAAGEVQLKGVTSAMPVFTVDEPPTPPLDRAVSSTDGTAVAAVVAAAKATGKWIGGFSPAGFVIEIGTYDWGGRATLAEQRNSDHTDVAITKFRRAGGIELRTDPKRKAATSVMLVRKPSMRTR